MKPTKGIFGVASTSKLTPKILRNFRGHFDLEIDPESPCSAFGEVGRDTGYDFWWPQQAPNDPFMGFIASQATPKSPDLGFILSQATPKPPTCFCVWSVSFVAQCVGDV